MKLCDNDGSGRDEALATLIKSVQLAVSVLNILILLDIVISYILDPFHPLRRWLDSLIEPMLDPIRRILPRTGMFDLSPIVLLILIQILSEILVHVLLAIS